MYLEEIKITNEHIRSVMSSLDELENEQLCEQYIYLPSHYKFRETEDIYIGQWWMGLRCGKGELYFSDGRVYQGNFQNDAICGKRERDLRLSRRGRGDEDEEKGGWLIHYSFPSAKTYAR